MLNKYIIKTIFKELFFNFKLVLLAKTFGMLSLFQVILVTYFAVVYPPTVIKTLVGHSGD